MAQIAENEPQQQTAVSVSAPPQRNLRKEQVFEYLPVSNAALYVLMKTKGFPKGFLVTPQLRLWPEQEVLDWIEARKAVAA